MEAELYFSLFQIFSNTENYSWNCFHTHTHKKKNFDQHLTDECFVFIFQIGSDDELSVPSSSILNNAKKPREEEDNSQLNFSPLVSLST